MSKRRHLRHGDQLDDDATVVIRGGVLDAVALRVDAQRYHDIYGEYGISVFAARVEVYRVFYRLGFPRRCDLGFRGGGGGR